ncbi:MAG: hypothetical protein Homavirus4_1, partial [Homavirus sp.]
YPVIVHQSLTWMYNILDGVSEQDNILFQNEYFVLLPDIKWDGKNMDGVYCLAIVKDRSIRSIRDLNDTHITMLENVYEYGMQTIKTVYNVESSKLRAYFHYHPTYWHLHIHFNLIKNKMKGCIIDIAHSLLSVINNIKIARNYYQIVDLEIIKHCN